MSRKLLILNGLAILVIPLHHATAYGLQAMFFWTDRYRQVTVPNFDQMGSLPYEVIVAIRQLNSFAVPAFLFISGFFLAFMARGVTSNITWKTMLPRIRTLIFPFIVWTVIRYLLLRQFPTSLDDVLDPYHFIPLLIQFYLLAPILVRFAKTHGRLLIIITALIHLGVQGLRYLDGLGVESPVVTALLQLTPRWIIFGQQPFWFPLGLVVGLNSHQFKNWLEQGKKFFLPGTVAFGSFAFLEYEFIDRLNGDVWLNPAFGGFTRTIYILTFLFWFLALNEKGIPLNEWITKLSARSLGIYLANIPFIYIIAVMLYKFAPNVLGNQLLYQTILFSAGLFGPLLLMEIALRSPARNFYKFIFG